MTDVVETEVSEPKGLDAIISDAINDPKHADFFEESPPDKEAAPDEAAPSRPRDERGRFSSANQPSDGTAVEAPPAETQPDQAQPIEPPRNFTAEMRAKFATLPAEAQQALVSVEKEREAEYTRRSQEIAEYRRIVDPWVQAVSPFQEYLEQLAPSLGRTPEALVHEILSTEYQLRNAPPAQRYQAFAQLAQAYGVNLAALTRGVVPQQQPHQFPQHHPVDQRLQRLEQLEIERAAELERQHSLQQISEFSQQTDEAGQPRYPHFERVRGVMASLIMSGQANSLEEAYEEAVRPVRDLIESEKQAQEKERQAALARAKKAAPVRTSTGAMPRGQTEAKGLSAHINAALAKAGIA